MHGEGSSRDNALVVAKGVWRLESVLMVLFCWLCFGALSLAFWPRPQLLEVHI